MKNSEEKLNILYDIRAVVEFVQYASPENINPFFVDQLSYELSNLGINILNLGIDALAIYGIINIKNILTNIGASQISKEFATEILNQLSEIDKKIQETIESNNIITR